MLGAEPAAGVVTPHELGRGVEGPRRPRSPRAHPHLAPLGGEPHGGGPVGCAGRPPHPIRPDAHRGVETTPPQPAQGEAEVDLVRRTDTPLEGTAPAHRSTVPRTSAGAPADHMGAALLAALRCSLTGPPCLVPRPVHRPTTWELRSSLRCGARSP